MPRTTTPMLGPEGLELERLVVERNRVILFDGAQGLGIKCPACATNATGYTAATFAPWPTCRGTPYP
jgi:hypothetical protein